MNTTDKITQMSEEYEIFPPITAQELGLEGTPEPKPKKDKSGSGLRGFGPVAFIIFAILASAFGDTGFGSAIVAGIGAFVMARGAKKDIFFVLVIGAVLMIAGFFGLGMFAKLFAIMTFLSNFMMFGDDGVSTRKSGKGARKDIPMVVKDLESSVWGVAGAGIGSSSVGTESTRKAGSDGEAYFGKYLNDFAARHGHVRVFHGCKFNPYGGTDADVDHIVVIGDKVFLLDSKNWKFADYSWEQTEEYDYQLKKNTHRVLRNGHAFAGGDVHMEAAEAHWRNWLDRIPRYGSKSKWDVRSYIVMTKESKDNYYNIDNSRSPHASTTLNNIQGIMAILENEAQNTRFINRYLLRYVMMGRKIG